MEQLICFSCKTVLDIESSFCFKCGSRQKCSSCEKPIAANANFCSYCGTKFVSNEVQVEQNIVKYKRTRDEVFCEVSLSNEVGKEGIQSLIQNLTNNRKIENNDFSRSASPAGYIDHSPSGEVAESADMSKDPVQTDAAVVNSDQSDRFPHITDLEMQLSCSEASWIAIFAFYLSDFGKASFSKSAVHDKYMQVRKTDQRSKNFSTNWKSAYKSYFTTIKDNEIRFKADSILALTSIILGNKPIGPVKSLRPRKSKSTASKKEDEGSPIKGGPQMTKRRSVNSQTYNLETDLNFYPEKQKSLKEFYKTFTAQNYSEIFLVIVYYFEKIIKRSNISQNTIYTCLKELQIEVPNIQQALNNIKRRHGWLQTSDTTNLKVSINGENHLEHKMSKK